MADVPFTGYAFPVTGGATNRTLPVRLAEVKNLKDWGATGDGVTDDWEAIQDAIEWNSIALSASVVSPAIPVDAARATCTVTVTGGQVTALTIGVQGNNYVPGQIYTVSIGGTSGGTGATATATANGSGIINQASLAVTAGGSGYVQATTTTLIEYPGHYTTLTFATMVDLVSLLWTGKVVDADHAGIIEEGVTVVSVNVGAKTVVLKGHEDGSRDSAAVNVGHNRRYHWPTCVVRGAGVSIGTQVKFCNYRVGKIFAPRGVYRVSRPINLQGMNFSLEGVGKGTSFVGNFDDYVLKRGFELQSSAQGGEHILQKFKVVNEHATGGCIQWGAAVGSILQDLNLYGCRGLSLFNDDAEIGDPAAPYGTFETNVESVSFYRGSGQRSGSFAFATQADGSFKNCYIHDFEHGIKAAGGQGAIVFLGLFVEGCDTGFRSGVMPSGELHAINDYAFRGCFFKNNGTAIRAPGSRCTMLGVKIKADPNGAPGGLDAAYGIRVDSDSALRSFFGGVSITGTYSVGGFWFQGSEANIRTAHAVSCYSLNDDHNGTTIWSWKMPAKAATMKFINCNIVDVYLYNDLPSGGSNIREGDTYNISNCNGTTFGGAAATGGSTHAKVRANQAFSWRVVGI